MRAAQGVTGDVKMAASDVLVALARSHFHFVMSELQSHLKAMRKVPDEIVLLTLGKMARRYALRCIPFVGMTLLALRAVLTQVGSGEVLHATLTCSLLLCPAAVLEQWSKGVHTYLCSWEQCPFPRKGVAQFCEAIYPVFRYVVANWLDCKEEEDKQAVLGAVAAMLGVLLHEEQHREHTWEQLLWLLQQYKEVRDTSRVTKSLSYVLEILVGVQTPIPQSTALAISTAVHRQLSDVTKEPGLAQKAVLSRCIMLQARMRPEETGMFLHSQLSGGSEAGRVAALGLLGVLAHSDAPAARGKLPQVVEAMCSLCSDPSAQVRRAVLEFSRELLSSGSQSCWPWDVVGHIFSEFSRTSGRLVAGGLFAWENPEDKAIRALCMDILGSLDVTLRGMTKLLWPRLLQYVVPAQYSGMLIPLSRCVRALVERRERAGCEEEEEEPDAMESQEQGRSPSECCCWVWPGVRPARISLRPTSPEQEPRKSKGQRQALLLGTRHSALRGPLPGAEARLSCSQRSPGEPGLAPGRAGAAFISCWAALGSPPASAIAAQLLSALSPVWGYRRCEARRLSQPFCLPTARLPAPQALLARLLVVAAAPYPSRERAVAALQLLQALHGRIHRGLGVAWATEIPLLLQYLEGRTESSLASAEWERRVLKFLRASLEPVEDEAWTVGLSQELSQRLGSSAAGSWEKLFLYKALGTVLAACQDLRHVQGQVLRFLRDTNPVELSEAKGMISVVSHAAESHFHLVLGTVTMFSATFTRNWSYQASTGWKVQRRQKMERTQTIRAALMRTYGGIALHAPKEQLLTCVDKDIMGNILRLSRDKQRVGAQGAPPKEGFVLNVQMQALRGFPLPMLLFHLSALQRVQGVLCSLWPQDLQLKLALVQSIAEVSCAIQAVGDCGSFELSLKQEATRTLLAWIKREPWDSLVYGVFQALEELRCLPEEGSPRGSLTCWWGFACCLGGATLERASKSPFCFVSLFPLASKLRPPLSGKENRNLLAVCCQSVLSHPSEERMKKGRKSVRAAVNMELLHRRGMEDLGHLIETLLEAEATSACFDDVVHVLKGWLTSAKEWERERALQVFTHVLGACKERCELMRGCPYKHFGSLVGLLGSLTSDCLATCRQRAWVCLGYLLQMQAKRMKVPQTDEIWCLCEELNSPHTETSAETCTEITKAVCRCIPAAQAVDFLTAVLGSLLHVMPPCARAVWKWVFVFLVECRKEIVQEVPKILDTLYSYMQQSTHSALPAPCSVSPHPLSPGARNQQSPPEESLHGQPIAVTRWSCGRSLGRSILGIRILRCLAEKLNRAGNDRPGTGSSTCERHDRQTALETLTITCAISEVVLALRSTEELRQLLPHLLPSLLRWASEMLGEERLLLLMSSWGELFLECQMHVEKPCRVFLSALELVLGKCMAQKWMQLLVNWAVWARLEDPLAYPEGVCLLSRTNSRKERVLQRKCLEVDTFWSVPTVTVDITIIIFLLHAIRMAKDIPIPPLDLS
ncbi:maestro heat-like repeat-containing protein family member 2B [Harpia harpyja]|uniref:maestro heat-like repeat-containing protein family member 2B n=1 Tax=Harpia harpyja TaxID=202280 RepID=UPI0022B0B103|nr:maestro heat-like repeat-containing protein family member 2B [Harpia harpyja]